MTKAVDWQENVTLHLANDGGGLMDAFKGVRHGALADLVRYIALLPEADRANYEIERPGSHRLKAEEIMNLYAREDFPHAQ
jgi:hypothetical protein